ncbi:MAG: tripartite tricarboxylate transporter permease, partial [Rhodobacteraceae bacterium]|nr:tripartite tricarboxylate transporter permease [Paracoccaceae bacterium]
YVCRKLDIPTVPIIMGILLGNAMENKLRDAMVLSGGEWTYLFSSPISTGLLIAAVLGFIAPMFLRRFITKPQRVSD